MKDALLEIIRNPITGNKLRFATDNEITSIKQKIEELYAREGIEYGLLEILVDTKLTHAFGIVDNIPVLLKDRCVTL